MLGKMWPYIYSVRTYGFHLIYFLHYTSEVNKEYKINLHKPVRSIFNRKMGFNIFLHITDATQTVKLGKGLKANYPTTSQFQHSLISDRDKGNRARIIKC